jgi:hypothetical protein
MAGRPDRVPRTVLDELLRRRDTATYENIVTLFNSKALELGVRATLTARSLVRIANGESKGGPETRAVLQNLFGIPSNLLLGPWTGELPTAEADDFEKHVLEGQDVVMAAADESSRFSQWAEQTNCGPHTLEQFESDIRRIVLVYPNRPVAPTFFELRELRSRAFELLEGRQHPSQTTDLYKISGLLCGLLANASFDLGNLYAAETQARTAFLCAELAGSNWLRSWVRGMQSLIAYWDDRPRDAVRLAQSGWEFTPESGTAQVRLAAIEARSAARLRNRDVVDDALARMQSAREAVTAADEIGGMIEFPVAKETFYSATANLWLGGTDRYRKAEALAADAIEQYSSDPLPQRRIGEQCLAALDLSMSRLMLGELDGAAQAARAVIDAGSKRPTDSITRRLQQLQAQLRRPAIAAVPAARELDEEIRRFCTRASESRKALPQ